MLKNYSRLTVVVGALFILLSSAKLMASENIELTAQGIETNLDAYRKDGNFTLAFVRYEGCKPCDEGEIQLQQWYDSADQQKISALIIHTDDPDQQDAVNARKSEAGIDVTSLFVKSMPEFRSAIVEITGKQFRAVPWVFVFDSEGKFIGDSPSLTVDWEVINNAVAGS